ncbi:UNVERIFIED_CONTAM: hypothetical protein FKN15_018025 [Acipenser sinensis]
MELSQEKEDGSWELFLKGLAAELCPGCGAYGHTVAICPTQYEEEELLLPELEEEEPVCPVSGGEEPVCPVSGGEEPVCPVSGGEEPVCPVSGGEEPVCPVSGGEEPVCPVSGGEEPVCPVSGGEEPKYYKQYDGFVVLHGTDTMAYTASALSFMCEHLGKTIILTGSQVPIYELKNDGRDNLLGALLIAGQFVIPEVCLYFHHKLYRGNRVTKVDAGSFNAFSSPNLPPLANAEVDIKSKANLIIPFY